MSLTKAELSLLLTGSIGTDRARFMADFARLLLILCRFCFRRRPNAMNSYEERALRPHFASSACSCRLIVAVSAPSNEYANRVFRASSEWALPCPS